MLCKFIVKNVLSFGELREFDMFPSKKLKNQAHHKYNLKDVSVLKMSSLYGANGAGKSNLIKAIALLQDIIIKGKINDELYESRNKFLSKDEPQLLGVEFIKNDIYYSYALEVLNGTILNEEIYEINEKNEPQLIIRRYSNQVEKISAKNIQIEVGISMDEEEKTYIDFFKKKILGNSETIIWKNERSEFLIYEFEAVHNWFEKDLKIIFPMSVPENLIMGLVRLPEFKSLSENFLKSLNLGIEELRIESTPIRSYFGLNDNDEVKELEKEFLIEKLDSKYYVDKTNRDDVWIVKEADKLVVKTLNIIHKSKKKKVPFKLSMESDGTKKIFNLLPILFSLIKYEYTWIIDEIERSIHPILIHKFLELFSNERETKGQLIFTTHETSLLNQNLFRQDEIWFVEKDNKGSTDLYPLSEFKEHHTKNIRNGYLSGRYGGIPFVSDLEKLNWNTDAVN